MAGTLPPKFLKSSEGSVATYDYYDISEGTGRVNFNLLKGGTSGATNLILSNSSLYGEGVYYTFGGTNPESLDSFETTFNTPKTIKGDILINAHIVHATSTSDDSYFQFVYTLYKNSTQIGTATSTLIKISENSSYAYTTQVTPITIAKTHFAKGDKLKIKVTYQMPVYGGGTINVRYGLDPKNRTQGATSDGSNTLASVPFALDL